MKNTTYSINWYDKETNKSTSVDLVDSTYKDWDETGEEITVERSFDTIIENAEYDTPDGEYFEIYDANDECGNVLYRSR